MHEMILCKLGEVVLKGLNRRSFEMKLMSNLRRRTGRFGKFRASAVILFNRETRRVKSPDSSTVPPINTGSSWKRTTSAAVPGCGSGRC